MPTGPEYMDRLAAMEKRLEKQRKRISKQDDDEEERVIEARERGEEITGVDELEKEKIAAEATWSSSWDKKAAKFSARKTKWDRRRARWEARK